MTNVKQPTTIRGYLGSALLIVLLTGCAGASGVGQAVSGPGAKGNEVVPLRSGDPDVSLAQWAEVERLKERVGQHWQARVKRDLVTVYTLHEPSFRRAVTLTAFLQGKGVSQTMAFEILGARVEGQLGIVTVKIRVVSRHPMLVKPAEPIWREFEEQWIWVGGEWFRKFRFSSENPYPPVDWDEMSGQERRRPN